MRQAQVSHHHVSYVNIFDREVWSENFKRRVNFGFPHTKFKIRNLVFQSILFNNTLERQKNHFQNVKKVEAHKSVFNVEFDIFSFKCPVLAPGLSPPTRPRDQIRPHPQQHKGGLVATRGRAHVRRAMWQYRREISFPRFDVIQNLFYFFKN